MAEIDIKYKEEEQDQPETPFRERMLADPEFMADAYSFLLKRTKQMPETDEDVFDKFSEHMRFHDTNEVTAVRDLMYAQEADDDSKEEFARLLKRWDESEGEDVSWRVLGDYAEAAILAPSTWAGVVSGGTGKVTGQAAVQAAKVGLRSYLMKNIGKGAVKGAIAEGTIGLGTGAAQEATRVETGAQEEFTGERTVLSALAQGAFGAIPGGIAGGQQSMRRLEAGQLRQQYEAARSVKSAKAEKRVRKAIDEAKKMDKDVVDKAQDVFLTDSVKQARKFLKDVQLRPLSKERVEEGLDLLANMSQSEKLAASVPDDVMERITAAALEMGKKIRKKPGERITETIQRYVAEGKIGGKTIDDFLDEFDLTMDQFSSVYTAEVSRSAKTLNRQAQISRATRGTKQGAKQDKKSQEILQKVVEAFDEFDATIGFGVNRETAQAIAKEARVQAKETGFFRGLDRLRLSLMTAQIATTVRNTAGGAFRVAVDVFDKGTRNAISRITGDTSQRTENIFAISEYLIFNQAEAKLVKQLFEENMPVEASKFYGAFLETATVSAKAGSNTSAVNKFGAAVNHLNRASDNMYKQAIFAGRLDQLVRQNMNKNLTDVIAAGEFNKIDKNLIKDAIEESLEYVYQKTPTGEGTLAEAGRGLLNLHQKIPFLISSWMPFPRFVINQLNFVAEHMPVFGIAAAKMAGKQAFSADQIAKRTTGYGLLASAYYMRAQAGTDSEWYHVKTSEGNLVDVRAIAGPMNAFLLAADVLYRTNAGEKLGAIITGKDAEDIPSDEVMSAMEGIKASWQALGGPAFRAGTGLATLDRAIESLNSESAFSISDQRVWGTFVGDTLNTFTLPAATLRDIMSVTDEEDRVLREGNYTNFWDVVAVRATRSLPTVDSFSLSEWISSTLGTGVVSEKEERIDPLTGERMQYIDPLERQLFGMSKLPEPNELQKEMMRLQIKSYDLFNPADYPEEERLLRQLIAPKVAEQLNNYVLSDEYPRDEPKLAIGKLKDKVKEIIEEYRPQVRERIETEQQATVISGESTEYDRNKFEKLNSVDKAIIREQYKRHFGKPMGEDYRGALEFWEESVKPRRAQMAEGGLVDDTDPLMLSETAEEEDPIAREQAGEEYIDQMTELGLDVAPVTGEIRSAQAAVEDFEKGNYGMAALGALGAIPGVGIVGRSAKAGIKALRSVDKAEDIAEAKKILGDEDAIQAWKDANRLPESQRQKRTPIVQQAAQDLKEGKITGKEYRKVAKAEMPMRPITRENFPEMPTLKEIVGALDKNKSDKGVVGLNLDIPDGTRIGSRLDIPAYDKYDTWVVSLHDGTVRNGKAVGYGQTAVLDNVEFFTEGQGALNIATKKPKATIARIHGDYVNKDPEEVYQQVYDLMDDPEWTQVGMNPFRHSFFYDKATGKPVTRADQVLQVGPLVLAKGARSELSDLKKLKIKSSDGKVRVFNEGGLMSRK